MTRPSDSPLPHMRSFRLALAALLVLAPAALRAQATTVLLVRHAEKAPAPASDPLLSDAGQARAAALADALADAGVQAVIVTPFQRTRLTAAPLVEKRGLTPQAVAVSPTHVADVARAVREHKGQVVLVVGHSNTIPDIAAALGAAHPGVIADATYDNLYVVTVGAGGKARIAKARYGKP